MRNEGWIRFISPPQAYPPPEMNRGSEMNLRRVRVVAETGAHVTDAARALETINSIKPSLFILDYSLPGIDGLKLADHLHLVEGLETIPIVMMSAVSPPAKEMRKRKITFLSKPFELNDLFATIEKLLAEQKK